jgi:hypothetical protein
VASDLLSAPLHGLRRGLHYCAASRLLDAVSAIALDDLRRLPGSEAVTGVTMPIFRAFCGTILVIPRIFQIPPCAFLDSSGINNSPRAEVWQPVVIR